MKKEMKRIAVGSVAVCLLLSGCGSSSDSARAYSAESGMAYAEEAAADMAYSDYYDDYAYEEYEIPEEANGSMEDGTTVQTVTFAEGKKIIYQSNVVLETLTYKETYAKLISLINKYEGYIEYENYDNELRSYLRDNKGDGKLIISTDNLTIRIPSKNYTAFMQEGLALGNVLNRNQTIEDKTSEYNTNKSYVDILNDEAEYLAKQLDVLEQELKEAQANDKHYDEIIENMKDIAERKSAVEKELVPYKRTMDDIDERVEYSTITMELREVDEYTVIENVEEEDSFGTRLKEAWNKAMTSLLNLLKGTLIFLITILPALVYIAIIGAIVLFVVKMVRKSKRYQNRPPKAPKAPKKKGKKAQAQPQPVQPEQPQGNDNN